MGRPSVYDEKTHETFFDSEKAKTFFNYILEKGEDYHNLLDPFYNAYYRNINNSYEMTKDLESFRINGDKDVVDLCEDYMREIDRVESNLVKQWVIDNNIQCPVEIGNTVKCVINRKEHIGEVVSIRAEEAKIILCCESEGHVKEGSGGGTIGYVVKYEDIIKL